MLLVELETTPQLSHPSRGYLSMADIKYKITLDHYLKIKRISNTHRQAAEAKMILL